MDEPGSREVTAPAEERDDAADQSERADNSADRERETGEHGDAEHTLDPRTAFGGGEERATYAVVEAIRVDADAGRLDVEVAVPDVGSDVVSVPVPGDAYLDERARRLHDALFAQGDDLDALVGEHVPVVVEDGDEPAIRLRAPASAEEERRRLPDGVADAGPLAEALAAVLAAVTILPLLVVGGGAVLVGAGAGVTLAVALGHLLAAGAVLAHLALDG